MPQQHIEIDNFAGGLISAYDATDVPKEAAVAADDLDEEATGTLRGRKGDATYYSGDRIDKAGYITDMPQSGGEVGSIVGFDDQNDDIVFYGPFDGTTAADTFSVSDGHGYGVGVHPTGIVIPPARPANPLTAVPDPYWLGTYRHEQFGDAASTTLALVQGVLDTFAGSGDGEIGSASASTTTGSGSNFEDGFVWFYAFSFVWDGFQESALSEVSGVVNPGAAIDSITLTLTYTDPANQPAYHRRISHINVYRARAAYTSGPLPKEPDTAYRLVESVALTAANWTTVVDDREYDVVDTGEVGATYEQNSGLPETLEQAFVRYTQAVTEGDRLYVANASHPEIADASTYVFASLPYRYGVFDWSKDFVVLPEPSVRLLNYGGRVFALGRRAVHRIGPGPNYEGSDEGVGIRAETAAAVGDSGFLFANDEGIYFHDGNRAVRVSRDIDTSPSGSDGWREATHGDGPWIAYHQRLSRYVIVYEKSSGVYAGFIYDPRGGDRGRWQPFEVTGNDFHGVFAGPDGEVYLSLGQTGVNAISQMFGSATRKSFSWTTPDFDLKGEGGARAKLYGVEVSGENLDDLTVEYAYDGDGSFTSMTMAAADDGAYVGDFALEASRLPVKSRVQLRIAGDFETEVDRVSFHFRPLLRRRLEAA